MNICPIGGMTRQLCALQRFAAAQTLAGSSSLLAPQLAKIWDHVVLHLSEVLVSIPSAAHVASGSPAAVVDPHTWMVARKS